MRALAIACIGVITACGTEVTVIGGDGGGTTTPGGPPTITNPTNTAEPPPPGIPDLPVITDCTLTQAWFDIAAYSGEDGVWTCGDAEISLEGQVMESLPGVIEIERCSPDTPCTDVVRLEFDAPELVDVSTGSGGLTVVPIGAFVTGRLTSDVGREGACVTKLSLWNLPVWSGEPNPISSDPQLYLGAIDGGGGATIDLAELDDVEPFPISYDTPAIDCPTDDRQRRYLQVRTEAGEQRPVVMGSSEQFDETDRFPRVYVRNLRTVDDQVAFFVFTGRYP